MYLPDEVQHGQAFLILGQTQTTPQLLQEDRQRLGGAQEQDSVHLRNIHAFIVDIHDEDEPHLTRYQAMLGGPSLLIGGFSG